MGLNGTVEFLDGAIGGSLSTESDVSGQLSNTRTIEGNLVNGPRGTADYNRLINKPSINTYTVEGDKLGIDYNLQDKMDVLTAQEIEKILYGFGI